MAEINSKVKSALINFFNSIRDLKELGIIRSDRYLGDIGEYIFKQVKPEAILEDNLRAKGHDAIINGQKYQIKLHNSKIGTNIYIGNIDEYDNLIAIIGPDSLLINDTRNYFMVFEFTKSELKLINKPYIAKNELKTKSFIKYDLD